MTVLSALRRLRFRRQTAPRPDEARLRVRLGVTLGQAAIALAAVAALAALLFPSVVARPLNLEPGDRAPHTIYAPRGFVFKDWSAVRSRAAAEVPPVWRFDHEAAAENVRLLAEVGVPPEGREAVRAYLGREPERGEDFRLPYTVVGPARVDRVLRRAHLPEERRQAVIEVLRPTVVVDEEATEAARRSWIEAHPPPEEPLEAGAPVIRAGDVLGEREAELVRQVNEYLAGAARLGGTGLVGYLLLAVALTGLYLSRYAARTAARPRDLGAIAVAMVLTVAACAFFRAAAPAVDLPGGLALTQASAPAVLAAMLLAILYGPRFAVFEGTLLAILLGATTAPPRLDLAAAFTLGGVVAAFGVRRARRREALFAAGAVAGVTQAVAISLHAMLRGSPVLPFDDAFSAFAGAAVLAPVLAIGSLHLFERLFGLTTNFRLMELSDLNHPILRRMLLEAPGTYQHSLTVASLAEAAAEAIDANSLLARVGCYFHDIGKIGRPEYFTENQSPDENPHEKIRPSLSAAILKAHVKDGIAMAQVLGLPEDVIRFIPEHHGTSAMAFFYHKALEEAARAGESADRRDFQYDGPKPQTPETAIAMLADGVEAACRSLPKPSAGRIERTVRKVVNQRFVEGELDECDLTLRDLHSIAEAFTRVLCGMYHARAVEYPEGAEIADAERRAKRAANGAPA